MVNIGNPWRIRSSFSALTELSTCARKYAFTCSNTPPTHEQTAAYFAVGAAFHLLMRWIAEGDWSEDSLQLDHLVSKMTPVIGADKALLEANRMLAIAKALKLPDAGGVWDTLFAGHEIIASEFEIDNMRIDLVTRHGDTLCVWDYKYQSAVTRNHENIDFDAQLVSYASAVQRTIGERMGLPVTDARFLVVRHWTNEPTTDEVFVNKKLGDVRHWTETCEMHGERLAAKYAASPVEFFSIVSVPVTPAHQLQIAWDLDASKRHAETLVREFGLNPRDWPRQVRALGFGSPCASCQYRGYCQIEGGAEL